jgi:hypothetical protein
LVVPKNKREKWNNKGLWITIHTMRIWISRLLIGLVTAWNLQAAFMFIFSPGRFAFSYELAGTAGEAAVRGTGVLFLMWNVPYLFALRNPIRYQFALYLALLMQFVGLIGESYILSTLSTEDIILRNSISRFIAFDGTGLLFLALAYFLVKNIRT